MTTFLRGTLALDNERRLLAMGAHDKLRSLTFAPCFNFVAIRKTEQTMTAHSITTIGATPEILALRRKLYIRALVLNSIIGQLHPAPLELRCTHPVPII